MAAAQNAVGGANEEAIQAVAMVDDQGIVVGWSRSAEKLLGYPAADILGRPGTDVSADLGRAERFWGWSGGTGDEEEGGGVDELRHRDGHPILAYLERFRLRTSDGTLTWVVTAIPAREGATGKPMPEPFLTTHSKAPDRLALLREANIRIGATLDVVKTAQELADLTVPSFADYAAIDLHDSVLPGPEPLERLAPTRKGVAVFRRGALTTIHEIYHPVWSAGDPVYVPPSSPFTEILDTGRSYLEPRLDSASHSWLDRDPYRARLIRAQRIHTMMIVPLKARGGILGIATFLRSVNTAPFGQDDVLLAEELADRAALSLDNARQYTRERTASLALQRQLLPSKLSGGDAVELAARYLPSDLHEGVGGDWYDTIALPDSRVALVIGDVTGHGIHAAASMGRVRTAVRTLAYLNLPPHELLNRLDDLFAREKDEENGDGESPIAATVLYVLYDPATRCCTMATAGHPPPAVVAPSGAVTFPGLPIGTPIGLGMGAHQSLELACELGTLIVLYTDGLIERRESDLDSGMGRLGAALGSTAGPLDDLCTSLIQALVGDTSEDDVTLLLARTLVR